MSHYDESYIQKILHFVTRGQCLATHPLLRTVPGASELFPCIESYLPSGHRSPCPEETQALCSPKHTKQRRNILDLGEHLRLWWRLNLITVQTSHKKKTKKTDWLNRRTFQHSCFVAVTAMSCHMLPWREPDTHSSFAVQADFSWWSAHNDRHPLPRAAREEKKVEYEKAAGWLRVTRCFLQMLKLEIQHWWNSITLQLMSRNLTDRRCSILRFKSQMY